MQTQNMTKTKILQAEMFQKSNCEIWGMNKLTMKLATEQIAMLITIIT